MSPSQPGDRRYVFPSPPPSKRRRLVLPVDYSSDGKPRAYKSYEVPEGHCPVPSSWSVQGPTAWRMVPINRDVLKVAGAPW